MSGETWSDVASVSDGWVGVEDSANGYVVALYVVARYVGGTSGATWADASNASTTWTDA